jgi:DNA-binding transcriptional MerR regulator
VNSKVSKRRFLHSSELAQLAGVSTDTLRHYEYKGLFPSPPRSANGYRQYPPETLTRVRLVQRALAMGFTLDELSLILAERDKGKAPCQHVRALAESKLIDLKRRLAELEALRSELESILQDWDTRLAETGPGKQAKLLEALADSKTGETIATAPSKMNGAKSKRRVFDE